MLGATRRPNPESLTDLILYLMLGTVIGGRLGQVILYEPAYYAAHPLEIIEIWNGGMAFHGGLIGVLLAIGYYSYRFKVPFLTVADLCATFAPIGLLLVRIGNFIKPGPDEISGIWKGFFGVLSQTFQCQQKWHN